VDGRPPVGYVDRHIATDLCNEHSDHPDAESLAMVQRCLFAGFEHFGRKPTHSLTMLLNRYKLTNRISESMLDDGGISDIEMLLQCFK